MTKSISFALSLALLIAFAAGWAAPAEVWARDNPSSGGYSRPSYDRTPATSSAASRSRTPSSSGGYSRPRSSSSSSSSSKIQGSASDQAVARRAAKQSLDAFRASTQPAPAPSSRRPTHNTRVTEERRPSTATTRSNQALWADLYSAIAASPTPASLNTRTAPTPTGSPASNANGSSLDDDEPLTYTELLIVLFLLGLAALVTILIWRKFFGDVATRQRRPPRRSGRQPYRPNWFRVGMTLPVDPSLFILAESITAIRAPEAATASGLLSVETLGTATSDGLTWYRLYLSGDQNFFQVHLDAHGNPDECRYFSLLDEVSPADAEEWSVWLDADDGLIGWPEFETKDGQSYQRLWAAGERRTAPRAIDERLESLANDTPRRRQQSMLYARSTGATAPMPPTEYLLVSAVEQDDAAWVTIQVGIDIPVSSLQLS